MTGDRAFWRVQFAAWTLYAIINFLAALPVVSLDERWTMAVIKLVRAATGLGVSTLLWLLYLRVVHLDLRRVAAIALVASAIASQAWFFVDRTLLVTVITAIGLEAHWSWFPRGVELDYGFVLMAWSGAFLAVHYSTESATRQRQALERELALRDAQLTALSNQLSPHFMFNTLNSIRSLIAEDSERAREMVTRLSRFLNATLDAGHATTLEEELKTIRAYLAIQQVRFEDALDVAIEANPDAARCAVPTLCLQPLVENAILYGMPEPGGPMRLRITAMIAGDLLRIVIANTGTLAAPPAAGRPGVGLANARARLAAFFRAEPRLDLAQDGVWVRVLVEIERSERVTCVR
jgi:hypothetical protein